MSQQAGPKLRTYINGIPTISPARVRFAHLSRWLTTRTVSQMQDAAKEAANKSSRAMPAILPRPADAAKAFLIELDICYL